MDEGHKYLQVERYVRSAIESGVFQVGDKLPSIRSLCNKLNVSKNTVIRAYQELEAVGLVTAIARSGYHVQQMPLPNLREPKQPSEVDLLSVSKSILTYPEYKERLPTGSAHPNIDFPVIKSLYAEIGRHSRLQSQMPSHYQLPPGNGNLIKQLLKISLDLGVPAKAQEIAVTHGAQQAISLALRALTKPGDIVAVESPSYFGNLLLMEALDLQVLEIPSCVRTGLDPNALSEALAQWDVKAIIVTPNFVNPTGARMTLEKRLALLAVSRDIPIIEDDVFGSLSFDSGLPSLKQLDNQERVIYVNSLSKTLDSRLRIGWLISTRYQAQINKYLLSENMGSLNLMQSAVAEFLTTGKYRTHLSKIRRVYQHNQRRFHHMLSNALNQHQALQGRFHLSQPEGSFITWLTLPEHVDSYNIYQQCKAEGISVFPGTMFGTQQQFSHCLRFCTANFGESRLWDKSLRQFAAIVVQQC